MNYRAFFNRKNEQPHVCSIDEGDQSTESCVLGFDIHPGLAAHSEWFSGVKPNPDTPCFVVHIPDAILRMEHGRAHFYPDPDAVMARISAAADKRLRELP